MGCFFIAFSQGIVVQKFPQEMREWKQRAVWLARDFKSSPKQSMLLLEILSFLNGDTTSLILCHWCKRDDDTGEPCCTDDSHAWNKLVAMLVRFFSKGYAVPLLYRMKHYAPAAAYIRLGCCLHKLLPRILSTENQQSAKSVDVPGNPMSLVIDALLAENSPSQPDQILSKSDLQSLVTSLLDEDTSYSDQNGVRYRMVQSEFARESFHQNSILIDLLVQRMEHGINYLLRRTKVLYDLQYVSHGHPNHEDLQNESKERFLHVIKGDFGRELVKECMNLLCDGLQEAMRMGLEGSQDQSNMFFQMVVSCVTDLNRRLIREFSVVPFSVLALAEADAETFVHEWQKLHQTHSNCSRCVDVEFTAALLEAYPDQFSVPLTPHDVATIKEIQSLCVHICIWAPLTSDAVEILNGQTQWALSRRGSQFVKKGNAAVETSLLGRAVRHYEWLTETVGQATLPNKLRASRIRRQAGTWSSNNASERNEDGGLQSSTMFVTNILSLHYDHLPFLLPLPLHIMNCDAGCLPA